jgi:hypothetical protein
MAFSLDNFIVNPNSVKLDDIAPSYGELMANHVNVKVANPGTGYETKTHSLKGNAVPLTESHASHQQLLEAKVKTDPGVTSMLEAHKAKSMGLGVNAHTELDAVQKTSRNAIAELNAVETQLLTKRGEAVHAGKSVAKIDTALEKLKTHQTQLTGDLTRVDTLVSEARTKVVAATGVKPPAGAGASITGTVAKEAGWFGKNFGKGGAMRTNWEQGGKWKKGGMIAGTAVGVVLVGAGLKEAGRLVGIVSPKLDDDGKELPRGAGTLFKSLAEVGAGAGLLYVSLIKGKAAGQGV